LAYGRLFAIFSGAAFYHLDSYRSHTFYRGTPA
jgi:hypothetical protein